MKASCSPEALPPWFTAAASLLTYSGEKRRANCWSRKDFVVFGLFCGESQKGTDSIIVALQLRARMIEHEGQNELFDQPKAHEELAIYLKGWRGYFAFSETSTVLQRLDQWIRRRLRCFVWKQWKTGHRRYVELRKWDVGDKLAAHSA